MIVSVISAELSVLTVMCESYDTIDSAVCVWACAIVWFPIGKMMQDKNNRKDIFLFMDIFYLFPKIPLIVAMSPVIMPTVATAVLVSRRIFCDVGSVYDGGV